MWNFDRPIRLCHGAGDSVKTACWMSAVSVFQGTTGDNPNGVCAVIRGLCVSINDSMADDATRARFIGPILFEPVDTLSTDPAVMMARGFIAADYSIRVFAPMALEAEGLNEWAAKLRALPRIIDDATAEAAERVAIEAASASVWASVWASASAWARASASVSASAWARAWVRARASDDKINEASCQMIVDMCQVGRKPRTNMVNPEGLARVLTVIGK